MEESSVVYQKRKLIALALISVVVISVLFLVIFSVTQLFSSNFALVEVSPDPNSSVSPSKASVVFVFNEELPLLQDQGFEILIIPSVNFIYGIDEKTLVVDFQNVLIDDTEYTVSVNNLSSKSDGLLPVTTAVINVAHSPEARSFIDNLPHSAEGFVIHRVSEYGVQVLALSHPAEERYDAAHEVMRANNVETGKIQVGTDAFITDYLDP